MPIRTSILLLLLLHFPGLAFAESEFGKTGGIVTTVKPLHSLVSGVAGDITEPILILKGATTPHNFQLKPSQVSAVQNSKLILYMGDSFEVFMESTLQTLPDGIKVSTAANDANLSLHPFRIGGPWEDGHADHDHGHDHGHDVPDLHVWLDPDNARRMVMWIVKELSAIDFDNRKTYKANALKVIARIDALEKELETILADVRGKPFIVFHDAYQYLEKAYQLNNVGSITHPSGETPPPARLQEMRDKLKATGARCVFREPQFSDRLIQTVIEGSEASSGMLDPLGADLADGPDLYFEMMRNLAKNLKQCLA